MSVRQDMADPWGRWSAATDEPLVLAAIERSHRTWLSAEAIAAESGLPLGRVQMVLDATPADVLVAPAEGPDAPARYSTRRHYRATTGLLRRYLDALVSS
jgi:hypothetical protein